MNKHLLSNVHALAIGRLRHVERGVQPDGSSLLVWPVVDGGRWLGLDAQRLAADGQPVAPVQVLLRAPLPEPAALALKVAATGGGGFAVSWRGAADANGMVHRLSLDAAAQPVADGAEAGDAARAVAPGLVDGGVAIDSMALAGAQPLALSGQGAVGGRDTGAITKIPDAPMSAGPLPTPLAHGEERINAYTASTQDNPEVAALANGRYVVVWDSAGQDGSGTGIYAQLFESNGRAVGPEWRVSGRTLGEQDYPQVVGLSNGGFVVVWEDNQGVDGAGWSVQAQRYDANGVPQGVAFTVNTTTAGNQYHGTAAAFDGGFAVAWSSDNGGNDIYLKAFDNAGVATMAEVRVSTVPGQPGTAQPGTQYFPDITADAAGNLVIVWHDQSGNDGSGYGVFGRRWDATTAQLSDTFVVNSTTSGNQSYPDQNYRPQVSMLNDGGFVVVWTSDSNDGSGWGIVGQRFDATTAKVGGEFLVNNGTSGSQYMPTVTGQSTGGFTVAWFNDGSTTGTSNDVLIREYDANGVALGSEVKLVSDSNSTEYQPSIADLGNGNFVVVYADYDNAAGGNSTYEIAQQLFGSGPALQRGGTPVLADFGGTVTFGENAVNGAPQVIDPVVSLTHTASADFDGGFLDLFYLQGGEASDQLGVRHVGNGAGQIGVSGSTVSFGGVAFATISGGGNGSNLVISFQAGASVDAVEALIENLTYASTSSSPAASRQLALRISDGDGGSTEAAEVTIHVTPELDGAPVVHADVQVNAYAAGDQTEPAIAVLTDGSYVIAWQSNGQDGNGWGIYLQRFAANGEPIGPELRANAQTTSNQELPQIAALSDGGYVLVWQDQGGLDGSSWSVVGQRYSADGTPQGANFIVNTTTSGGQYHPSVAAYDGGFAVAWASDQGNDDIYLKRYDNAGNTVLGETLVSTVVGDPGTAQSGTQYYPDIVAKANGDLVIVWHDSGSNDGSSYGVYGRLWNAGSQTFSDTFLVNTTTTGQQSYPNDDHPPKVALLAGGGFVVVWSSNSNDDSGWAVMGQRFDAAGNKVGGEFQVNETTAGSQYQADVIGLSTGGFVVSFYNDNYDLTGAGSYNDPYIREYDAAGNAIDGQRKLVTPTATGGNVEYQPAIADLGNGNFVVAYADHVPAADGGNATFEITQQIFGSGPGLARSASPTIGDFSGTVTVGENAANAALQAIDSSVSISDADSANFDGGRLDLFYVQGGRASDQLGVRHQGNGPGQIGVAGNTVSFGGVAIGTVSGGVNGANLVVTFNANADALAVEALVESLGYGTSSVSPQPTRTVALRISDGDGGTSAASTVTINVTPERDGAPEAHGPEQVNTYTPSTQEDPEIAVLADGSYVITWTSNGQDGSGDGVYFQRFAANGTALGAEVRANTSTASAQNYPHAAALSDGGFVLVWQDNSGVDGSGYAVMAQRYAADGTAQGINFAVNTTTSSNQYHGTVAGYDGGFAVVWSSTGNAGGSGYDIYLKRFDNTGTVVLAETRLSTVPNQPGTAQTGTQELPAIASDAVGNLVVVWQDTGSNDGGGYGVYARTVAANGTLGNTILVNSITAGNQYEPDVAMLAGGGFVVVWGDSSGVDGSSWGVYGQRFDAAGNKVGAEFLVNETTAGGQYQATVTALSTGGFVVGFYNDNYDTSGAGSYNDVYIREYDAAGNAIDGQRKLSGVTATGSNQEYQPAIADLGNGNFVVAYADYVPTADGGNATFEITQQLFGSGPALARQANPVLGDFGGTVVFAENTVNSTPQVLDASVSLTDVDSADFAGGQLSLFYIQGGQAGDQLGVRHQGNGAGQIGVSGNTVSFGGVAIGTLGGGMNGANLVISFNANASVDAVEALVQNLTYASTSSSPQPSRTAALRITDGDGGVTQASQITIQVTGELDGAAISHGPEQVNSHTPGAQDDPEIAVLANGSYVITWTSNGQDGSGDGVYFQRFAANGTALGAEVRANTSITGGQNYPHAAALSDGGFVLVWQDSNSFDGSGYGVVAQRYAADGTPQGANFVVNTFTSSTQDNGAVAGYDGGFAVVWSSSGNAGGSGFDIYLKRFDNSGNEVLAETRLSTAPGQPGTAQTGTQELPSIASDAAGNLVVVWQDTGSNDGNGYGVYARTVAANGTLGNTILVNSITAGNQYEPDVAMLAGGGFVVVWGDSSGVDGASWGVYGQRFDAAGTKVGAEFLVNETTAGGQYQATVTALSTGGFVVGFYNDNYDTSGTGTQNDVYIREYDAAGNAIDGQRKLASPSNSTEYQPAIADLGNGNFVVAYADYNNGVGGNNTYEINQQLFGSGPSLDRNAPPVIGDVMATRLLSSTAASPVYAANPQRIDGDVSLTDADSSNFDGGQLLVSLTNGATPTETLGVLDQGNGAGQIGVTGAEVRFGGNVIGMISGGGAGGSSLVVTFNASADIAAVRALIESVTYQNSSPPAGTTDRGVSFRLTDGDGGVSAPASLVLRIQATVTPQTVALDDVTTSLPITESQAQAGVLVDDAVQLVYSGATGFANGKLTISYLSSTGRPADQLAITNEGTGDGQVGVSGTDVSFGGAVIGSISASLNGVNGTSLEITFNASATPDAVEQVIEALRYANISDGPLANRSIRISLTDGAGQASTNRDVQISITPEADPAAAVALTGDLQANTYEAGSQANSAVGRLQGPNDGSYVIVWESQNDQDGSGYSVQAQRFAANGQALGAEIRVNSYTYSTQNDPAVDGLNDGGFVVAWTSAGQDGSSNGVYAQRYDGNGQEVGSEFRVNTTTTSSQNEAAVLALADGGFLIAYSSDYSNTAGNYTYDVLAQRYGADGLPVGGEITLNTNLTSTQDQPQLARLTGGGFVATWQDSSGADGNGWGIIAQRYAADGSKLGAEIVVNTTITGTQESPDVAGLSNGGFVVAWHYSNATYAQVLDASGAKVGAEIRVSDSDAPANYNSYARVTALDDGGFVVAWDSSSTSALGGSGYDIVAQQFDNAGNRIDGQFIVNTVRASTQIEPDLVGLAGSNFVVSWSSYDNERSTVNTYGIFHQVRGAEGSVLSSAAPVLADVVASVTFDENVVNAAPQIIDAGVGLSDADSANFDGGHLWVSVISSYPDNNQIQVGGDLREQDQLSILHQGNGAGQVGVSGATISYGGVAIGSIVLGGADGSDLVVQFNAQATSAAVEAVIERLAYANTSSDPGATRSISISVSDGDGATSIPRVVTVNVTPQADGVQALFGNEQVNTYQPNTQDEPAGTGLSDGSYVIVWASEGQDGSSTGVHGQRFSAVGERLGAEFEVNSQTLGTQSNPAVASLTGGGFVVVWQSNGQDGSGWGTYAQRFANDGTPLGGEVRVNTSTDSSQYQPVVTGTADGGYVVAWYDDYYNADFTELGDIYFQRFDASGVAVGPETQGNTSGLGTNYQYEPAIAGLAGGGFVLLWRDDAGDGSSTAVRGQVFNAAGVAQGSAFLANTYTNGGQYQPDVAALQGGGFVATWYSDSQDGSSGGAYAQRFDAAGNKLGDEFRVHTDNQGTQYLPSVTALDGGGFAISWYDAGRTQVQQFAADGTRIDGNTLVDTRDNNGNSAASDVFGLQGGGFVVAFQDYDYGTSNYNVYQQIFGNPALMQRQAAPVLGDVDTVVSFDESDVNAGLQRIDASIDVSDADSANFDGGQLIVSVLSGYGDIS
ncbi:MAG: hypothetical protein KDG57_00410, partial [Rhodoferax sp.]|nr:hypothetical protein [Rhodoferax sp.]